MKDIKPQIQFVSPDEMDYARKRLCNIHFECRVSMYDFAQRTTPGNFFVEPKALNPEWFKLFFEVTMEGLETADPTALGMQIQNAYRQLKEHVEQYEKQ